MANGTRQEILSVLIDDVTKNSTNPIIVKYIKDYIQAGYKTGFINDKNLSYVVSKLMHVERFANLPQQYRGIYGATFHNNNSPNLTVCINPDLDDYRRELYSFHEFRHVIMDGNTEVVSRSIGNMNSNIISQVEDGYTVIEEAIAQNSAEEMMASLQNRRRTNFRTQNDPAIPNISFKSDFGFYGLYQPIASRFARTLRGIGSIPESNNNPNNYLNSLTSRAFDKGFIERIMNEYQKDGHFKDLMQSFYNLGVVYRVKQKTFGINNNSPYTPSDSAKAYKNTLNMYASLEDRRPPLENQR